MRGPLKTTIEAHGQSYLDRAIEEVARVRREIAGPIATTVRDMIGSAHPSPLVMIVGYERVRLNWVKPRKGY